MGGESSKNTKEPPSKTMRLDSIDAYLQTTQPSDDYRELRFFEDGYIKKQVDMKPKALTSENCGNNRHRSIFAYDHSAVELRDGTYINASKIPGFNRNGEENAITYIATQGPLQRTVDDFYVMLLEMDVRVIVMLTRVAEEKIQNEEVKTVEKCTRYWPPFPEPMVVSPDGTRTPATTPVAEDTCPIELENLECAPAVRDGMLFCKSVVVKPVEELIKGSVIKRVMDVFRIEDREFKNPHRVVQMQFIDWPDHGAPKNLDPFFSLIDEVEEERATDDPSRPFVVHCSAGVGRTGTFCVVHHLVTQLRRAFRNGDFKLSSYKIDMPRTIWRMKECRINMVENAEQYAFCYRAILEEAYRLGILHRRN